MNFSDLKISTRMTLGFGLMSLLICIMGGLSLTLAKRADSAFHTIIDDRYPKVLHLHVAKEDVVTVELALTQIVLEPRPDNLRAQESLIAGKRQEITRLFDELGRQITSDKGKAALAETLGARGAYSRQMERFFDFARAGKIDEARSVLTGPMVAPRKAYFDSLSALIAYQEKLADTAQAEAVAAGTQLNVLVLALTAVALVLSIVLAVLIVRSTTRPLQRAVAAARAVASGDLSQPIAFRGTNETAQLLQALHSMQTSLARLVGQVRHSCDSVANSSAEIAQGNNDLSMRTEEQASALEETAASMEQLNATVHTSTENARQANALALDASTVATRGGHVVAEVVATMKGINDSSQRISDIIGVIDSIAFQTNILALNAAVEAARAGEQGRGFAVVATEVRNLAGRSAEAAREIKGLIVSSVERVEAGTALVDRAGQTMTEVVQAIHRVSQVVGEITAATGEQSQGIDQINEAVMQIDQTTQQNAALVEEMAAAATSLNQQATALVQTVAVFKLPHEAPEGGAAPQRFTPPVAAPALLPGRA
ncbi:methyl-accepting chemotaxis protein [Acidovorax sp.]|jgi:methyl-accepting chemotaxis protein|uniref:methyl-accepting chemotaxis protein n=1 Tax=Acidovorax sp. TaxID=1872122 RepID=UPI0025C7036D|nr:methyl-accepting chemotaxis protein [Acidovorax sp.]